MLRLLNMEDKQILSHQEATELVNLGTDDEVKIGSFLDSFAKKEITTFFREYANIFACSYHDMLGLSIEIVEHQLSMKPECRPV